MLDFASGSVRQLDGNGVQTIKMINPFRQMQGLRPLTMAQRLASVGGNFEVMSSIVDSGATIPTMHPEDAKDYELMESEASRAGVEYEVANGENIANLGEKKFAVLTTEGTLRGYQTQCAEACKGKPLHAVRALLASSHAVCFGLGENGQDHLIINKTSGEINRMRDDGINYLQDLLIIPPDRIEEIQQQLWTMHQDSSANDIPPLVRDFAGQGH